MRMYEISEEEVKAVLEHPDHLTGGAFGREHAWRRTAQGRWLRVTFRNEGERHIVVTVTPKRRFSGGTDAH